MKKCFFCILFCCFIFATIMGSASCEQGSKKIFFSGYTWYVKEGFFGPDANWWAPSNVWVDEQGSLHLKIKKEGDYWSCAEVSSVEPFLYGTFRFSVVGPLDKFDPNCVLGLFLYPQMNDERVENELDIEISKWGGDKTLIGYTVVPEKRTVLFPLRLDGTYTTHEFSWSSKQVNFASFHGHTIDNRNNCASWLYIPSDGVKTTIQPPTYVHMNFWLLGGNPLTLHGEAEIIIRSFQYLKI